MNIRSVVNSCGAFYGIQVQNELTGEWETIPNRVMSMKEEQKVMEANVTPPALRDNNLPKD